MSNDYDPLDALFFEGDPPKNLKPIIKPPKPSEKKRRPRTRKVRSGVYFIRAGEYIKIGYSRNIARRMATLQCANPVKLKVVFGISSGRIHKLESILHRRFRHKRVAMGGKEWFRLDNCDLDWVRQNYPTREVY